MFLDDMISLLVTAGAGTYGGATGNIRKSSKASIPTLPSNYIISLTDSGGTDRLGVHNSDGYARPSASVIVRADTVQLVETGVWAAYHALVTSKGYRVNFLVGSVWYVSLKAAQEPHDIGLDDVGRLRYVFNVDAVKRPS